MSSPFCVTVRDILSENVWDAATEAVRLARHLGVAGVAVEFEFNGVNLFVSEDFTPTALVKAYERQLAGRDAEHESPPEAVVSPPEPTAADDARRIAVMDWAICVARGCLDYSGGYRNDPVQFAAFRHGIATVVAALEATRRDLDASHAGTPEEGGRR